MDIVRLYLTKKNTSSLEWVSFKTNIKLHSNTVVTAQSNPKLINRPSVAGAVQQSPLVLIHSPQVFQRFRIAEQIYTFKLVFNTLLTLAQIKTQDRLEPATTAPDPAAILEK